MLSSVLPLSLVSGFAVWITNNGRSRPAAQSAGRTVTLENNPLDLPTTRSSTMFRSSIITVLINLVLCATQQTHADGIQDNIPDNVRRIPELGVAVPDDRAASMRTSIGQLQEKIAAVKATNDTTKAALLPDVMIFERAVRCALDYQEFFDVKEFDKADALLAEGINRADQLLAGTPAWITRPYGCTVLSMRLT